MNKILALCLFLLIKTVVNQSTCNCPSNPEKVVLESSISVSSPKVVVHDGIIFDMINVGDFLLLNKTLPMIDQSTIELSNPCPTGFIMPDFQTLSLIVQLQFSDKVSLIKALGVNANSNLISSTKSYPNFDTGSESKSWQFKAYKFDGNNTTYFDFSTIFQINDKKDDTNPNRVICVFKDSDLNFSYNAYDYVVNRKYASKIIGDFYNAGQWKIEGVKYDGLSVNYNFSSTGCKTIEVWALTKTKKTIYNCVTVFVKTPTAYSEVSNAITADSINKFTLEDTSLEINFIFFNRVNVALSPREDGGFYIFYSDIKKNTKVVSFDSNFKQVGSVINIESDTFPLDIVATYDGFAIFFKSSDNSSSIFRGYKQDGTLKFSKDVINNGILPTVALKQITFYDEKGVPKVGTDVMFATQNGKLAYGKGKIGLIFAHYNFFGMKNGNRDDHNGDTYYVFDEEGNPESYAWSWGTSHSLNQVNIYSNRYFVTASLGDLYPKNIQVCMINLNSYTADYDFTRKKNVKNMSNCSSIITNGIIPGDAAGNSAGRIGGIFNIGELYYIVYSRNSSTLGNEPDKNGEIGLITFNYDPNLSKNNFTNRKSYNLGSSANLVNIRSSRFGNKIVLLIAFSKVPVEEGKDPQNKYSSGDQKMSVWVVDIKNPNLIDKFEYPDFIVPVTEDIKTLKDGTIAWGYVDTLTKKVGIAYIKLLNSVLDSSLDYITISQDIKGQNYTLSINSSTILTSMLLLIVISLLG